MGSSPESTKRISKSTSLSLSNPTPAQEPPIFSYASNLSPIEPGKTVPVEQVFSGINCPPFQFRTPQSDPKGKRNYLERSPITGSSEAESSRPNENVENADIVAEESGISSNQLRTDSTSSPQKAVLPKSYVHEKSSSTLGNTDDHLSVIENMEGGTFASSANLSHKNSDEIFHSQNEFVGSKESVGETANEDQNAKDKLNVGTPPVILEQAEENYLGPSLDSDMPQDACPKVDHNSSEDHVLSNQHGGELKLAGSNRVCEVGSASQLGCMHIAQDSGVCENAVQCIASSGNNIHDHSPKVGQHHPGISRRLQFEDSHGEKMADIGFKVSSASAGYHRLTASSADAEVPESASTYAASANTNGNDYMRQSYANMNATMVSSQNHGNHNIRVPKPSGIGLHLNSIIAKQRESASKLSEKSEGGSFDRLGRGSISIMSGQLQKNYSISTNVVGGAPISSNVVSHSPTPIGAISAETPYSTKPLFEPVLLKQKMQLQSNYSDKRKYDSDTFDSLDDSVQSSPTKKRKKTTDADDGDGCKRCNCKKTQCLKLYCDCFAAGIYCAEPCACQDCFNRPEYEDTVLEVRQQIESRNPLAFAPKIIQHISEPRTNVRKDEGDFTPSSGRHKRGCNCKKSKCLKKYCECYQANVGCSDGCRCEGCDNVYGRKEEYCIIKDPVSKQGNSEKLDSSFGMMPSKGDLMQNDLYPHNISPLTPQVPCSINGKGASRTWFSGGRYLQSPDSDLNLIPPFALSPATVKDPDITSSIPEANTEIMDLVSFQQDYNHGNGHTPNQFSPSNVDNLTPATFPNPQDSLANTSRPQILPGNRQMSSESSLRWRRSPITPLSQRGTSKLYEIAEFEDRLFSIMDDDTPEILKEDPLPSNAVKVTSPNKKRVSPPHTGQPELGSSSSTGLRTCRRFVLRGIPPMQPSTPCIQSQGDPEKKANSQSSSSTK